MFSDDILCMLCLCWHLPTLHASVGCDVAREIFSSEAGSMSTLLELLLHA